MTGKRTRKKTAQKVTEIDIKKCPHCQLIHSHDEGEFCPFVVDDSETEIQKKGGSGKAKPSTTDGGRSAAVATPSKNTCSDSDTASKKTSHGSVSGNAAIASTSVSNIGGLAGSPESQIPKTIGVCFDNINLAFWFESNIEYAVCLNYYRPDIIEKS